ncbi:MAG: STAS domain-containing protein [Spirochaetales bacterium]|nr:STAS domain-containing protein [Spirochaetales bacterium]
MVLQSKIQGDTVYFKIDGAIDTEGGADLSSAFQEIMENSKVKNAEFDMREVPSITSAGIGKLLKFFKHFDKGGGSMSIAGISEPLRIQFEEIHLNQIIPIG